MRVMRAAILWCAATARTAEERGRRPLRVRPTPARARAPRGASQLLARRLDLAGRDLLETAVASRSARRGSAPSTLTLPKPTPPFLTVKMPSVPPLNVPSCDLIDRREHGDVDLLRRARQDVRAEVAPGRRRRRCPRRPAPSRPGARRGRSRRRPRRRPSSLLRSGSARAPCTSPGRRSPASSRRATFVLGFVFFAPPCSRRGRRRPAGTAWPPTELTGRLFADRRSRDAGEIPGLVLREDEAARRSSACPSSATAREVDDRELRVREPLRDGRRSRRP